MAIQLPSRKAPQGRRQYAQPITRKNIKRVPNAADPGGRGGPNAAATPGAFGGGKGLETAGNQLTALGEKWAKENAQEQAQRNALLSGEVTDYVDFILGQMASNLKTSQKGNLPKLNLPNANTGGGHQGPLNDDGSIPDMGHWKQNTGE
tara:strand:+ start:891 stop:1337 length:447 start_codon:yes stop_codon:yes gene_type:complete